MPLPDFLIIGAMKAGTTSLHENLKLHPEIGMSRYKEPNYFTRSYSKGLEWYESIFPIGKKKYGEASPSYAIRQNFPETAERIFETIPEVKVIYILRDPIDRIISHLHHNLYRDRIKLKNINQEVLENPSYISTSKYYFQISPYLELFERKNILFVNLENLKNNPSKTLNEICDFLGVGEFNFSKDIKSFTSSQRYLIKYHDSIHRHLPKKIVRLYHWFFYFLRIRISRPILEKSTLISIKEALKNDIKELSDIAEVDISNWHTYNKIKIRTDIN